jgi:hypothetical protein
MEPSDDKFAEKFAEYMKEMSTTARDRLCSAHIPGELRDKIINDTSYGNWSKQLAPLAEVESFREMIDIYYIIHESVLQLYPGLDPSWLIQIIETFIEFLKTTPQNSVPIFDLLRPIVMENQYLTLSQVYARYEGMPGKYRTWVERFIKYPYKPVELEELMQERGITDESLGHYLEDSGIAVDGDIGKGITRFFDKVVVILSDIFDEMTNNRRYIIATESECPPNELYERLFLEQESLKEEDSPKRASLTIRCSVFDMIPIFEMLKLLDRKYLPFLTFERMLKLDSALKNFKDYELKKFKDSGLKKKKLSNQGGGGLTRKNRNNKRRSNKRRSKLRRKFHF